MAWVYEQSTGIILRPDWKTILTKGYSGGNLGKNPEGKNNPQMQDRPGIGPLPRGKYTIGAPEMHPKLGPFALPLMPDPANEMFGRAGFFIHGDSIKHPGCASEGCIILPRWAREVIWNGDRAIEVVQ